MSAPGLTAAISIAAVTALTGCGGCPPQPAAPHSNAPGTSTSMSVPAPSAAPGVPYAVVREVNHRFEFGRYSAEVDASDGGRIIGFSLGGRSIVVPREESPDAYGSSFWPSPQSDWKWPPPPALDRLPWTAQVEGTALLLESRVDSKLGLAARQRIQADPERGALRIDFGLENRGTGPRRVAPWQNTRVRPGGLTFYPSSRPAYDISTLKLAPDAGVVWFQHDPAAHPESVKLYADGDEGWVAHVDQRLLLVKVFPDISSAQQAPAEGEVVIYVHGSGRFVEVEQQGAYAELQPGATSTWTVRWLLSELPPEIAARPGESALVELVRRRVAGQAAESGL